MSTQPTRAQVEERRAVSSTTDDTESWRESKAVRKQRERSISDAVGRDWLSSMPRESGRVYEGTGRREWTRVGG